MQHGWIITKIPDPTIAMTAQQPAHNTCRVIMVNTQHLVALSCSSRP
jgi:hypothetical protein